MGSHASSSYVEVKKEVQTFSENFPGKNPIDHPCIEPTIAWRKRMSSFHPLKSERLFISMLRHASVHNGADMMTRATPVHYSADGKRTALKMWWVSKTVCVFVCVGRKIIVRKFTSRTIYDWRLLRDDRKQEYEERCARMQTGVWGKIPVDRCLKRYV